MWEDDDEDDFDVEPILEKLLAVSKKNPGTMVNLELDDILSLIEKVKKIVEN